MSIKITGTGSCIPNNIIENKEFIKNNFFDKFGNPYPNSNLDIIDKFQAITGIQKRRYADKDQKASDLPKDFKKMVEEIRSAEIALGKSVKKCQPEETQMSKVSRKSLTLNKQ